MPLGLCAVPLRPLGLLGHPLGLGAWQLCAPAGLCAGPGGLGGRLGLERLDQRRPAHGGLGAVGADGALRSGLCLHAGLLPAGEPVAAAGDPLPVAAGAIDYRNRLAPGATWVPAQVVQAQQPVWRAVRPQDDEHRGRIPLVPVPPPSRPVGPPPGQGARPAAGCRPRRAGAMCPSSRSSLCNRSPQPGSGVHPSDERRHPCRCAPHP
jgi:hypothetical protein